jgi:hypothetical protein
MKRTFDEFRSDKVLPSLSLLLRLILYKEEHGREEHSREEHSKEVHGRQEREPPITQQYSKD